MSPRIFDCEQGSAEWLEIKLGLPSASMFHAILAKGKEDGTNATSKTRRDYMLRLAGEILSGEPAETYTNGHMERGKALEDEARQLYQFTQGADLTRVGFVVASNGVMGCSPDSLIGSDGVLEIKTALPHILLDLWLKKEFPPAHKAQCQGNLLCAEREFVDIAVYWPKLLPFIKRAGRDEPYIRDLEAAVERFNTEVCEVVAKIKQLGAMTERGPDASFVREFVEA
jgi:hypothetical protein